MLIEVLSVIWLIVFVGMLAYVSVALYTIWKLKRFNKKSEERLLKLVEIKLSSMSEAEVQKKVDELVQQGRQERYEYVKFQEKWYSELFDFGKYRYEAWIVLNSGQTFTLNTRFKALAVAAHQLLALGFRRMRFAKEIGWRDVNANDKIKYIKGVA